MVTATRDIANSTTDKPHKARINSALSNVGPKLQRVLQAVCTTLQTPDSDEQSKDLLAAASGLVVACVSLSDIVEKGTKSYARFRPGGESRAKVPGFQASMRELA